MDYESACSALQTVCAARLFYEYGKLDRLLEWGITQSADDLREIYFDLLYAGCDYVSIDYNENFECFYKNKSFFRHIPACVSFSTGVLFRSRRLHGLPAVPVPQGLS